MKNQFYSPGELRAAQVQKLFATIARRYDLLNDVMSMGLHRHWKCRLVKMADTGNATSYGTESGNAADMKQVLDLCCGTGDIALRFYGNVVGLDFSAEMLRCATVRAGGLARVSPSRRMPTWIQADALRLPFPENSFDVVSLGYGLRNLADLPMGIREIWRVLRPGGKLLSLDFGKPECKMWRRMYFAHLRFWVPLLGRVLVGQQAAYAYILTSLENYPAQRGVQQLMEECGFEKCGFEEFCGGAMAINFGQKPLSSRI